jgi:ketohexokinase
MSAAAQRVMASFGKGTAIDFSHCIYRNENSEAASSYIIRNMEKGSRTIVNHNGLPEMTVEEFASILSKFNPEEESWWHFEVSCILRKLTILPLRILTLPCLSHQGRIPPTTLECIRLLRQTLPRSRISLEVEKPGRDGLLELAAEVDTVFYSRAWAEVRGTEAVCVTTGYIPNRVGNRTFQTRGHKSAESCLRNEARGRA